MRCIVSSIGHIAIQRVAPFLLIAIALVSIAPVTQAADSTDESLAAYADAANFQTNGAFDLAIDAWKDFLKEYPKDKMASRAAHYLGVCYMQKESPDYAAAAEAFERALKNSKFELREESLANQGWCWYAASDEGETRNAKYLKATIAAYDKLQKEKPKSQFLDRALFYSGEASYGLGDRKKAIDSYNKLLALPAAKDSPLRCDALYSRGIAHEELDQIDKALSSYQQLTSSCEDEDLITDVYLRIGDLMIYRKDHKKAIDYFSRAIKATKSDDDKAYAIFRQAFAMVQDGRPAEAAKNYARLEKDFPDSKYAGTALMAAAQSNYRSGNMKQAAAGFRAVLKQKNAETATEAAHWLSRILIREGNATEAAKLAKQRIDDGAEGEYAVELKLDYAEALSLDPKTVKESIEVAESVYRKSPDSPLAPRALYNAAFSALQTGQADKALKLSTEFLSKFSKDDLVADVQFIAAEGNLLSNKPAEAAKAYRELLKQTPASTNQQRPMWVLRGAAASNAAKQFDDTVDLLKGEYRTLSAPAQKAEAQMLIGFAYQMTRKFSDAAKAYQQASVIDPTGARSDEAKLLSGVSLNSDGKAKEANDIWKSVADNGSPRMADQARYKLAQAASRKKDFASAVDLYGKIVASKADPALIPYALYGQGWSLMQDNQHKNAVAPLDRVLKEFKQHPVGDDALLARGISLRHLNRLDDSAKDLAEFLELDPKGINLGHALYELALIDQKQDRHSKAAKRLQNIVDEVPKYPSMEKVLYELGWSQRESGDDKGAEKTFAELVKRYPEADVSGEAAYVVGQTNYSAGDWKEAAKQFLVATKNTQDKALSEKAHYRLGWSYFKSQDYSKAQRAFQAQADKHGEGKLALDAMMMVGECKFEQEDYRGALASYEVARRRIRQNNDTSQTVRDAAEQQVRELILLHGGQSASQQRQWDNAIAWYEELKTRFPSTDYLPQLFYETGYAHQQKNENEKALKYYSEIANKYRSEIAARSRFMMGEIYFAQKQYDKAIPEFQRVMFGFNAQNAPNAIKNWQAKSGFEAGRCSEQLMQIAKSDNNRNKARQFAGDFFKYVIDKHPDHELAKKSKDRLNQLK